MNLGLEFVGFLVMQEYWGNWRRSRSRTCI